MAEFYAALALTAVGPAVIDEAGGTKLSIIGEFKEETSQVWIVDGADEYPCYGGKSGEGYFPFPDSADLMFVASPPLPIGGPYTLRVKQGASTVDLVGVITVVARVWETNLFELRRVLPPWYATGRRNLDTLELLLP